MAAGSLGRPTRRQFWRHLSLAGPRSATRNREGGVGSIWSIRRTRSDFSIGILWYWCDAAICLAQRPGVSTWPSHLHIL